MITQNLGTKKALEMGHLPQTGDSGMIKILETMPDQTRKILITLIILTLYLMTHLKKENYLQTII